jgi:hypothetical protein
VPIAVRAMMYDHAHPIAARSDLSSSHQHARITTVVMCEHQEGATVEQISQAAGCICCSRRSER